MSDKKEQSSGVINRGLNIVHLIAICLAFYLALYKCNGDKLQFKLGPFLAACCCPQFYMFYLLWKNLDVIRCN